MKIEWGANDELVVWPEKSKVYPPKSMETASRTCIVFADDFCALEFASRILRFLVEQRHDSSSPTIDAAKIELPSSAPQLPPADEHG